MDLKLAVALFSRATARDSRSARSLKVRRGVYEQSARPRDAALRSESIHLLHRCGAAGEGSAANSLRRSVEGQKGEGPKEVGLLIVHRRSVRRRESTQLYQR